MIKILKPNLRMRSSLLPVFAIKIFVIRRARNPIRKKNPLNLLKKNTKPNQLTTNLLFYQVPSPLVKSFEELKAIVATNNRVV